MLWKNVHVHNELTVFAQEANILRLGLHAAIFKLSGGSISIDESGGEQFVKTHRDGVE